MMEKDIGKYKIALSNQRNKFKDSSNLFNQYVMEHIKNHTERDMDLLSFLRFKAPGLVLDYDSLDKDFFTKDKVVAARTVTAMNEVKMNCEYQRPRGKDSKDIAYDFYKEHYKNAFENHKLHAYNEQHFYELYRSFCEISLSPLYYEMHSAGRKVI